MEERNVPCSVLLIGENPSDTSVFERALSKVHPDAPVTVARHHQDVSRSLSACGLSAFRVAFFIPSSQDDAELLTIVRSAPGGGATRIVVLLHDHLVEQTKPFYLRGAHSVVTWPNDPSQQERLAERLAEYWEDMNLPSQAAPSQRTPEVSVL
jgi:hypothetical protein